MIKVIKILLVLVFDLLLSGVVTWGISKFIMYPRLDRYTMPIEAFIYVALIFIAAVVVLGVILFFIYL